MKRKVHIVSTSYNKYYYIVGQITNAQSKKIDNKKYPVFCDSLIKNGSRKPIKYVKIGSILGYPDLNSCLTDAKKFKRKSMFKSILIFESLVCVDNIYKETKS